MSGFTCPHCNKIMAISGDTCQVQYTSFEDHFEVKHYKTYNAFHNSAIAINFYKCPSCNKYTILAQSVSPNLKFTSVPLIPSSFAKQFPDYIPEAIRSDYEEAYAIVNLSPKASATLSRRCLQGMIHDYWDIKLKNLNQEITALKDKISDDLWTAIDSLRELGNIGAHMEKDTNIIVDIDSDEAARLLTLVELLMKEWYINREDRKRLLEAIPLINNAKQEQRKKIE